VRSGPPAGHPLLGLSKDRPSIVRSRGVRFPGYASPRRPSRKDSQSLPRAALVVSHHLDGLILLDRAGLFRPAADPGVRPVSPRRETRLLSAPFPPFEAFPPPTATESDRAVADTLRLRGAASRGRPLLAFPFTAVLASSPFRAVPREADCSPSHPSRFPASVPGAGASRPCSIVGSVVQTAVASCMNPVLPWA